MNEMKEKQVFSQALKSCNITSIWKRKGPKNNFESYRGIFRITVFRNILDRLIYNDEYPKIDSYLSDCNVGGRKGRNVRDNIFVLNAIMNSISKGIKEPHDVQVYDLIQCFDSMWLKECINSLYEAGLDNDRLNLLYLSNASAQVAVKTAGGITERNTISNIVMQGTVWGNIFCVSLLDKLGKYVYDHPNLIYYYKQSVPIPPLEMVDDVLAIQKCGSSSLKVNTAVNTFMESEKLCLSETKSNVIHVGSKLESCNELKVHNKKMHESKKEKYLGDTINRTGSQRATIQDRKQKGFGIIGQIIAIIKEAPLGQWRMRSGMLLRNSMLINSMLFNSEAWHGIVKDDIQIFSRVDESLLRALLSAHSKTPKEALFLETGQIPVQFIWASRRLNFLQTIMKRNQNEITKKVYKAQKADPKKGDFAILVKEDKELIELDLSDEDIERMDKMEYQNIVKRKVKSSAFVYLQSL